MATSVVEIWNIAIARVPTAHRVSVEGENSPEARLLRVQWPLVLDRMLEGYDWAFARRYGALTDLNAAGELADGWQYAYEWPLDALAFRGILNPAIPQDPNSIPFDQAIRTDSTERKILTDMPDAQGKWTVRIIEPKRYPPTFIHALSYALQSEITLALSKSQSDTNRALALLTQAEAIAKASTASQAVSRDEGTRHVPDAIRARA